MTQGLNEQKRIAKVLAWRRWISSGIGWAASMYAFFFVVVGQRAWLADGLICLAAGAFWAYFARLYVARRYARRGPTAG